MDSTSPDDYAGDRTSTGQLAVNGSVSGVIETLGDVDAFHMALSAGVLYTVEFADFGPGTGSAGAAYGRPSLSMSGPDGSKLAGVPYYTAAGVPAMAFQPAADGDYTLAFSATSTGGYSLRASAVTEAVGGMDPSTATGLAVATPLQGTLDYQFDADWYRVQLNAGVRYRVSIDFGSSHVTNGGVALTAADGGGGATPLSTFDFTPLENGPYLLKVGGFGTGGYTVKVDDASATPTPWDSTAPQALRVRGPDAANFTVDSAFLVAFDEQLRPGSATILLHDSDGSVVGSYKPGSSGSALIADNEVLLRPGADLLFGHTYSVEVSPGAVRNAVNLPLLNGASFSFTAPAAAATIHGSAGDDLLEQTGGNDAIDGGAGLDTVVYHTDAPAKFVTLALGHGTVAVDSASLAPEYDQLTNVERIRFNDQSLALDVDGAAGQVFRLYRASCGQAPDAAVMGQWLDRADHGMAALDMASALLADPASVYGAATDDAAFVQQLYQAVLHRAPDASGQAFWADALAHGVPRAELLRAFSDSPEYHDATAALIGVALPYLPVQ